MASLTALAIAAKIAARGPSPTSFAPKGPFGAKGVSEAALLPTAPAIINAIYDAVGVRIRDLPATPVKILAALKAQQTG